MAENGDSAAKTPRHRGRWAVLAGVVIVGAGLFAWLGYRAVPDKAPSARGGGAPPVSIAIATVERSDLTVSLQALGTVTSLSTVTVRAQVSGQLLSVGFVEGQDVKAGDPLAQIDPRPFQAALDQAKAQLQRDEAQLATARVDLERYQGLAAQNAVPRQTLDTQKGLVAQNTATVEADKAQVQTATINLGYTTIRAPVEGRAGLRQVDAGNYVTPGDANGLVVLTLLKPISVIFSVPEDRLDAIRQRLRSGATLAVHVFDRTGQAKLGDGKLETFDSQIDQTTGTIRLRGTLANDDLRLFPNQFVNVTLDVDIRSGVAVAPMAAIQRGVPGTFVYVLDAAGTSVAVRPVTLGVTQGQRVEIAKGLEPGDRIVLDGADRLRDGARVAIRPPPGAPPEGAGAAGRPGDAGRRAQERDARNAPVAQP